ncbi:DNA topoisomerase 3-alpha [Zea mays]|uniref:DNA topoisomerase n=1 Tax=Zea mays TaxID=4577 RepID=A0A1D6JPP6_MAIZE|nr:DNA topoisomerase 3-alpha [Zea mays]
MQPDGGGAIRVLNVAEKPSVAKAVAEILSRRSAQSRAGRSQYNRIFEFNYAINGRACHMLVTSVTGHLMELEFDDRFRRWHSCDPAELFHAPVRKSVPQDKQAIKQTLEEEARRCQWLVLWLDCDREGENIAYEVIDVCTRANSHLNIWRARFSALIDRVLPVKLPYEIDLRIGASFTRFQTMLLKDAFVIDVTGDERSLVLSYGPCQFPTLGFIVERFWEIQAHEPEEFWTINCTHTSDEGTASFGWIRGHLFDYSCAISIYEMCVSEPMATVQNVRNQEKLKYPPYPLSTVELQKRASRMLPLVASPGSGDCSSFKEMFSSCRKIIWMFTALTHGVERYFQHTTLGSRFDIFLLYFQAGIGTDATMHDHIKKLLDRCYATKDENTRFSPTNLGEALVMGYDEMGYELWKPYLRSMMEADMKSVSVGTKSKSEVLESCLQQMKACFLDARVKKAKLLDAMGTFFARSNRPINETQNPVEVVRPCGACNGSEMLLKRRASGEFMVGCRSYPQVSNMCRNVVWLPGSLSEAAVTNQVCPICAPGPVYKIQFKFRRRDIPPNFDVDHLGCVGGCDDILKDLMEISRFGSRSQAATPARGPTPNGVGQGTPRQDLHTIFRPASQLNNDNPSVMHSQGFRSTHTQNPSNASDAGQVLCTSCGALCISRIANTEANRGRRFYKCQDPGCGFFKYVASFTFSILHCRMHIHLMGRRSGQWYGERPPWARQQQAGVCVCICRTERRRPERQRP